MSNVQIFMAINIVGGLVVLAGYAIGLSVYPENRLALWGGVQGNWRLIFTLSMMLSTIGYLLFTSFAMVNFSTGSFEPGGFATARYINFLCLIFLVSASMWMPSTIVYVNTQSVIWWIISVMALWVTALSLAILFCMILGSPFGESGLYRQLAMGGLGYIAFHCLVFDAIIWIYMFAR